MTSLDLINRAQDPAQTEEMEERQKGREWI